MEFACGKCFAVDDGLPAYLTEPAQCSVCGELVEVAWDCHACDADTCYECASGIGDALAAERAA